MARKTDFRDLPSEIVKFREDFNARMAEIREMAPMERMKELHDAYFEEFAIWTRLYPEREAEFRKQFGIYDQKTVN